MEGELVGSSVGLKVVDVGFIVGSNEGSDVGFREGSCVGLKVGSTVGCSVGSLVGPAVDGDEDGASVSGGDDGIAEGFVVGTRAGVSEG